MKVQLTQVGSKYSIYLDDSIAIDGITQNTMHQILKKKDKSRKYKDLLAKITAIDDTVPSATVINELASQFKSLAAPDKLWHNVAVREIKRDHNIIYVEEFNQFYIYKEGFYASKTTYEVKEIIKKYMDTHSIDIGKIRTLFECLKIESNKNGSLLNNYPKMFNLENGIFDTETKYLIPHSPDYYFTYKMNVKYNATPAATPTWDKYCKETTSDADIMKNWLYNLFTGNRKDEFMLWLVGKQNSGKSTFFMLLEMMFGNNGMSRTPISSLGREFAVQNLIDGLVNIDADINESSFGAATISMFKKLIDTDAFVDVNKKHAAQTTMKWKGFMVGGSNNLPEFSRNTDMGAIMKRVAFVRFPNVYPNNPAFKQALASEIDDIFSKIVNMTFTPLKDDIADWISTNMNIYTNATNHVARFIEEQFELKDAASTSLVDYTRASKVYGYVMRRYRDSGIIAPGNLKQLINEEVEMMGGDMYIEKSIKFFQDIIYRSVA